MKVLAFAFTYAGEIRRNKLYHSYLSIWLLFWLIFHMITGYCVYLWYLNETTCFQIIMLNALAPDTKWERLILSVTHLVCMWENKKSEICSMYASYAGTLVILCNKKVYGEIINNIQSLFIIQSSLWSQKFNSIGFQVFKQKVCC